MVHNRNTQTEKGKCQANGNGERGEHIFCAYHYHNQLSNERSRKIRYYLHDLFPYDLGETTRTLGSDYFQEVDGQIRVNEERILDYPEGSDLKKLGEFNRKLKACRKIPVEGNNTIDPLEAVEAALSDFDLLAVPFYMGIKSVNEAVKAYRDILEATAPLILPFVIIQKKLRGSVGDPKREHRKHYLYLLHELGVPLYTQGPNIPNEWISGVKGHLCDS